MAKTGMDEEALSIQRAAREIDKLEDAGAQARVALYLYLRYTTAGDGIASGGTVALPPVPGWAPGPMTGSGALTAQQPASGPAGAPPGGSPRADAGPAGGPLAGLVERMVAKLTAKEMEMLKVRFGWAPPDQGESREPPAAAPIATTFGRYSTLGPDDLMGHERSPAPATRGLDLSGKGSEHDDDASDLDLNATPAPPPEIDTSELDGDPEVEI